MGLRKITYILIISFIAAFLIRTIGTLFPHVFKNIYVVKVSIIVNTFFIIVHFLFWVFFLTEYASNRQQILRTGIILAIIGTLAIACIYIKNLCLVFEIEVIPLFLMNPYFDAFIPLISSLFHFLFYYIFKKVQTRDEYRVLNLPIISAMIGIVVFMALHLIVIINFLIFQKFDWLEHMPRIIAMSTIPFIAFSTILILYFYSKFYQFLRLNRLSNI